MSVSHATHTSFLSIKAILVSRCVTSGSRHTLSILFSNLVTFSGTDRFAVSSLHHSLNSQLLSIRFFFVCHHHYSDRQTPFYRLSLYFTFTSVTGTSKRILFLLFPSAATMPSVQIYMKYSYSYSNIHEVICIFRICLNRGV